LLLIAGPVSADAIVWGTPDIRFVGIASTPPPSENIHRAYPEDNAYPSGYGSAQVTVSKPLDKILRYSRGFHCEVKVNGVWNKSQNNNQPLAPGYYPSLQVYRFTFYSPAQTLDTDYVKLGLFQFVYADGTSCYISPDGLYPVSDSQAAIFGQFAWCGYTKDPANTSSGNNTYSATDFSLPGKGLGLVFTRSYNSQDGAFEGPLGYGWNNSYQMRLLVGNDAGVTLVYPDGRRAFFQRQTDGSYRQPQSTKEKLVKNVDYTYTVTCADQTTLAFSSDGRLTGMADRYGNQTTLTYGASGQLSGVADPGGRSLTIAYSGLHISSITDSASRSVTYGYDANGNLTTVTDPNGHTTTYAYDCAHQLTSVRKPEASAYPLITNTYVDGQVERQTDALSHETELSYDPGGRLTRTCSGLLAYDAFSSDCSSNYAKYELVPTTAWSFSSGKWKQTAAPADAIQRRNSLTTCACVTMRAAGSSDISGRESFPIIGCYAGDTPDAGGQIPCYRLWTQVGQTWINLGKRDGGVSTTLDTDTITAPTKNTFYLYRVYYDPALGRIYGKLGQTSFTTSLDATDSALSSGSGCIRAGQSCAFDWLDLRISHQITCTGLPTGYKLEVSDGTTTASATESGGTAIVDAGAVLFPLGQVRVLDSSNQEVTKLTCADLADMGGGDVFAYDENAPLTGETEVTDNNGHTSIDTWDPETFRLIRHTDALNHVSSFAYTPRGWLASVTDENDHTTKFGYDMNGNTAAVVDAEGHVTRSGYDAKNNPLYVQDTLGEWLCRTSSGLLSREDFTTNTLASYTLKPDGYDANWTIADGVLTWTYANPPNSAALTCQNQTTARCVTAKARLTGTSGYPEADLILAQSYDTGSAWNGYMFQFPLAVDEYRLYKRTPGTWTYLATKAFPADYGAWYLERLIDAGSTLYAIGGTPTGLLTDALSYADTTYADGAAGGIRCGGAGATAYQCDWLEVRTSHQVVCTGLPSGYKFEVSDGVHTAVATESGGTATVDAKMILFPLAQVRVLDAGNREVANLTSADLADMGGGDVFHYDGSVGHRTTFTWDPTGTYLNSVTSPVGTTGFTWNTDGTLATTTDARSHTWEYGYNTFGDLVSVTDPLSYVRSYEYDAAGRVTTMEDANSSRFEFTYDAKGNLTSIKDPLAELDPLNRHLIDITYDANDNLTEIEDARGNTTSFTYDDLNRLTLVQDALAGEAAFTYDASHNLTSVEDPNGNLTTYTYDPCDRIATITDALSHLTAYDYDPAGNLTSITFPGGSETTYTYDACDLLSEVGYTSEPTTWSFSYDPTHALTEVEKNDGKTWGFTYDAGVVSAAPATRTTRHSGHPGSKHGESGEPGLAVRESHHRALGRHRRCDEGGYPCRRRQLQVLSTWRYTSSCSEKGRAYSDQQQPHPCGPESCGCSRQSTITPMTKTGSSSRAPSSGLSNKSSPGPRRSGSRFPMWARSTRLTRAW
jgi:YD repeat-containing protein